MAAVEKWRQRCVKSVQSQLSYFIPLSGVVSTSPFMFLSAESQIALVTRSTRLASVCEKLCEKYSLSFQSSELVTRRNMFPFPKNAKSVAAQKMTR